MRAGPGTECPLKIGQDVEVLSHVDGYRGGYFRCKIHDMTYERDGRASLYIEYLDFPGERACQAFFLLLSAQCLARIGRLLTDCWLLQHSIGCRCTRPIPSTPKTESY